MSLPVSNIQELLNDPNASLDDVLRVDAVTFLFNQSVPSLIQFFVFHAEDLLNSALCSKDKIVQSRAYTIVHSDNSILLQALLHRKIISNVAETYFFSDSPDFFIISRLVHIIEMCVCDYFDDACSQFYFITELVRFLDNPAVIEFFSDCINHIIFGRQFVQWLNDLEFDQRLMDTIEQQNTNNKDFDPEFAVGLYQVLDICLNSPQILSRFLAPSRLSVLIQPIPENMPVFVRNAHAKMVLDICNEYTIQFVAIYANSFLDIVKEKVAAITPLYLNCFQILCQIYRISPDQMKNLFSPLILIDTCFRVLTEFQEHSIALSVASQFLVKCAKYNKTYRDEILKRFLPMAESIFEKNYSVTMRAVCMKIMTDFEAEVDWEGCDKAQFNYVNSFYLDPIRGLINNSYGGEVPKEQSHFVL